MRATVLLIALCALALAALLALGMWLWRCGRVARLAGLALLLFIGGEAYLAVNPPESFYREEYTRITGQPFPAGARFLFKDASYPDFQGDYTSCALLRVSPEEYERLRTQMPATFAPQTFIGSDCLDDLMEATGRHKLAAEFASIGPDDEYRYWALVDGEPEVVIHYVSW
ncbi:MAG: hypothetical protein ACREVL_13395 [Solimonas sp.]